VIDAAVLAGGVDKGDIAAETGVVYRSLLEVGGRPIIRRVLAALRGASEVGKVALVAPQPVQDVVSDEAVDVRVEPGDGANGLGAGKGAGFVDNMARGVEATAPGSEHVLVITGDLPLITPAAINDFVRQSLASRADLSYAIIPKESSERQFPGGRRTYVRLRDGTFTGGNAVVVTRDFVRLQRDLLGRLFSARKSPLQLALILGLRFIIGLLTHGLTLAQIEARARAIIRAPAAAIISTYPELGFDVDKLDDLYLARRFADSFDSRL